jgi:hypothetical protein
MAQSLGLFGVHIPITPDIVAKIRSVALEMSNEDDLTTRIHPFTFAYLDTSEIAEAYAIAEQYKMLHDDKGAPTLQDAVILATTGRVKMPKSFSEAHIYFQNFRVAIHVLLGSNHALTKAYDAFWRRWSTSQQYMLGVYTQQPGMFPTLAVCWVQLCFSLWLAQQAMENSPLEVPNFAELLNHIRLHTQWEPSLPPQYYNTRSLAAQQVATIQPVSLPVAPGAIREAVIAPTITSGVTAPPTIKTRGTIVRKTVPINPAFQKFVDMNLRVRDVLQRAGPTNRVPNNNNGTEMCLLSYHLKGICNSNCSRHQDHREHQPADDQAIVSWCDRNYKPE